MRGRGSGSGGGGWRAGTARAAPMERDATIRAWLLDRSPADASLAAAPGAVSTAWAGTRTLTLGDGSQRTQTLREAYIPLTRVERVGVADPTAPSSKPLPSSPVLLGVLLADGAAYEELFAVARPTVARFAFDLRSGELLVFAWYPNAAAVAVIRRMPRLGRGVAAGRAPPAGGVETSASLAAGTSCEQGGQGAVATDVRFALLDAPVDPAVWPVTVRLFLRAAECRAPAPPFAATCAATPSSSSSFGSTASGGSSASASVVSEPRLAAAVPAAAPVTAVTDTSGHCKAACCGPEPCVDERCPPSEEAGGGPGCPEPLRWSLLPTGAAAPADDSSTTHPPCAPGDLDAAAAIDTDTEESDMESEVDGFFTVSTPGCDGRRRHRVPRRRRRPHGAPPRRNRPTSHTATTPPTSPAWPPAGCGAPAGGGSSPWATTTAPGGGAPPLPFARHFGAVHAAGGATWRLRILRAGRMVPIAVPVQTAATSARRGQWRSLVEGLLTADAAAHGKDAAASAAAAAKVLAAGDAAVASGEGGARRAGSRPPPPPRCARCGPTPAPAGPGPPAAAAERRDGGSDGEGGSEADSGGAGGVPPVSHGRSVAHAPCRHCARVRAASKRSAAAAFGDDSDGGDSRRSFGGRAREAVVADSG
ncbi:hypothetical protein BU14_0237s0002 [Porphyra umbilicalis]|uniref:Uncharacterized protein n=1 Tax=Porphyra umbilicalis TaxID=2786 RepID=A0A1X6P3E9_PORUM|nr:hypothetical protein BU14_0237s0002 [Porphyra umbilicalis]|eukprot:OSX75409.1 hypothetical protein BU14_0237s0002 [Porphyra umbilicalis]